jgi:etoposide-induced 2.4 mRNA
MGERPRKCRPICTIIPCGAYTPRFLESSRGRAELSLQYVIMAMHAQPVPQDPFNPQLSLEKTETVRYPSPLVPIRLPIFSAVIWLNDLIVRILSVGGTVGEPRHKRVPSNSSEKAEEGAGVDLHRAPPGTRKPHQHVLDLGRPVGRKAAWGSDRRKRD